MKNVKKQSLGFWATLLVAVLAIASLAIYVANVNAPYYEDMNLNVIYMMAGALVAIAVSLGLSQVKGCAIVRIVTDLARIAACALIIWAGVTFLGMRLESFGYIYGSNLELGNEAAFSAGGQAIWGIILFMVTWVLSVVAAFMKVEKKA